MKPHRNVRPTASLGSRTNGNGAFSVTHYPDLRRSQTNVVKAGNQSVQHFIESVTVLDKLADLIVEFLDQIYQEIRRTQT
jgi:hypothetical protein